jgi:hypothetical protein
MKMACRGRLTAAGLVWRLIVQAGADVRIKWSKAASDAVDPAPMAMMICL